MRTLPHSGWSGYEVLTGDVNGNGRDDLIWSKRGKGNRAYVGLSRGDGTFVFRGPIDFPHSGWSNYTVMTGDVDDDGRTDLIFNSRAPINRTYVALSRFPLSLDADPNNALPSFDLQAKVDHPQSSRDAFGGYTVHTGDFNADGCTDLLWNITKEPNRTYISFSRGDGTFVHKPAEDHPRETWGSVLRVGGSTIFDLFRKRSKPSNIWGGYQLVVADVNGDRRDDLLWNHLATGNRIYLATSRGDGSLNYVGFQDHPNTGWSKFSVHPGGAIQGPAGLVWNSADPVNRLYVANPMVRAIPLRDTPGCTPP